MLQVNVSSETAPLKAVVLGTAESFGGAPKVEEAYDPKSIENILNDTFPEEERLVREISEFESVLKKHNVEVFRPNLIEHYNQIFSRDIGFVIDNVFVKSNVLQQRGREIEGIQHIIDQIPDEQVIVPSSEVSVEGGDVVLWEDYIFIGYSEEEDFNQYTVSRTNSAGLDFLQAAFPHKRVKAFELSKSDEDPRLNTLHLDCCFQPIGRDQAIVFEDGFKNAEDYQFLQSLFGQSNLVEVEREEMYQMNANVFSINQRVIVSERNFKRLNNELRRRGFEVEEIMYQEVAKMEGLLRCSTLPLIRA
ncbi:MAG: amidinotransferase [Bacteroidota bacterium]